MKKTKIVCTIGPSSNNEEMLRKMIAAGMNVARFNFSHGSHETQKANLDLVKKVREEMGAAVATMIPRDRRSVSATLKTERSAWKKDRTSSFPRMILSVTATADQSLMRVCRVMSMSVR